MFSKKDNRQQFNQNQTQNPFYLESQIQRLYYELEEQKRKSRNLNKRVRRIEKYLNLRNDEINDENYSDD